MSKNIGSVSLVICPEKPESFAAVAHFLTISQEISMKARMNRDLKDCFSFIPPNIVPCSSCEIYNDTEAALVFGGDGSIIRAASQCAPRGIPILGINFGRVGYLANINPDQLSLVSKLASGDYSIEHRMMIAVSVFRNGVCIRPLTWALNDAVVSNGSVSRMVDLTVFCDNNKIMTLQADGVIVATPTGSTAYSMSAGGPIIDPKLECFCITPICPHVIAERPVLFSATSVVEIQNNGVREGDTFLTIDGVENFQLLPGDIVRLEKATISADMICLVQSDFYSLLSKKMAVRNEF